MRELKRIDPQKPLTVVCRQGLGEILLRLGLADQVIEMDKSNSRSFQRAKEQLRREEFEWVICPHESVRSHLLVASLKAQVKVGFKNWWNFWVFDHRIPRPMIWPDALRQLSLLCSLDESIRTKFETLEKELENPQQRNDILTWSNPIPEWASMGLKDRIKSSANEYTNAVFLAPGSVWPTKRWTPSGFVNVGLELQKSGFDIVLVGSAAERELCEQIQSQIPGSRNLAGQTTLYRMLEVFAQGRLLITNDSGAMHLASVAELPLVSVFGPTTLSLGYRPWSDRSAVVQKDISCRPCGLHGSKKCPIGTHACMEEIDPEQVLKAARLMALG